jgi:hypothetical protein
MSDEEELIKLLHSILVIIKGNAWDISDNVEALEMALYVLERADGYKYKTGN